MKYAIIQIIAGLVILVAAIVILKLQVNGLSETQCDLVELLDLTASRNLDLEYEVELLKNRFPEGVISEVDSLMIEWKNLPDSLRYFSTMRITVKSTWKSE